MSEVKSELARAQEQFVSALLTPDAPVPDGLSHPQLTHPAHPGNFLNQARFDIYRNNVIYSLHNALRDKFPSLLALLGEARFEALADAYIRLNPPRLPMLAVYGDDFADFITRRAFCEDVPYASDIAQLEIMRLHAYHAADHTPLAPARFQDEQTIIQAVKLAPSLRWLCSDYPLYDIWQFLIGEADTPSRNEAQSIVIYRTCDFATHSALLPPAGTDYLAHLQAGLSLTAAAQATPALTETDLQDIMILLIHQGLIADIMSPHHS